MKRKDLEGNENFQLHHTGSKRGYVSRKSILDDLLAKEYAGRFGIGYTVDVPRWDTSNYCGVEYWIAISSHKNK